MDVNPEMKGHIFVNSLNFNVNPIRTGGKSSDDPYLKRIYLSQLLVADTPMNFFSKKFSLHPQTTLLRQPVQSYSFIFC